MAEVTLGFDELEEGDLPLVCMQCGSRRNIDFVERKFLRRPLFTPPGLIGMAMTKRARAAIPLCEVHGGPRLMSYQSRPWWGLSTAAIGPDEITIGGVHENFADALRKRRAKKRRGEDVVFERPRRCVYTGRGPGGMTTLKVLVIVAAGMVALMLIMACGMFGLMALSSLWLSKAPPRGPGLSPSVPAAVAPVAEPPARPEGVAVGLLAVAPAAGLPGAVPWMPLAQSKQLATLHFLEDAELNKLLADLKSPHPAIIVQAAKRLAKATPDHARRIETAAALETALANPFPIAKEAAAEALGQWGTVENMPALLRMAGDPNPSCRRAAENALAAIRTHH